MVVAVALAPRGGDADEPHERRGGAGRVGHLVQGPAGREARDPGDDEEEERASAAEEALHVGPDLRERHRVEAEVRDADVQEVGGAETPPLSSLDLVERVGAEVDERGDVPRENAFVRARDEHARVHDEDEREEDDGRDGVVAQVALDDAPMTAREAEQLATVAETRERADDAPACLHLGEAEEPHDLHEPRRRLGDLLVVGLEHGATP